MNKNLIYQGIVLAITSQVFCTSAETVLNNTSSTLPLVNVFDAKENSIDSSLVNIDKIDPNGLNKSAVVDIASGLGDQTSIDFDSYGDGIIQSVKIRGFGKNYSEVTIDGVKMPENFTYGHGWYNTGELEGVDMASIKQIDIVKGRNSPKQSGGALAGSINLRTYRPSDFVDSEKPYYIGFKSGYNSKNKGFSNTLTGAVNSGDLSAMLIYTNRKYHEVQNLGRNEDNTTHAPMDYKQNNMLLKGEIGVGNKGKIIATGEYFKLERDIDQSSRNKPTLKEPSKRNRFGLVAEFDNVLGLDGITAYANYSKSKNINGSYSSYSKQFKLGHFKNDYIGVGVDAVKNFDGSSLKQNLLFGLGFTRNKFDFAVIPDKSPSYRPSPVNVHKTIFAYAKDNITFNNGLVLSPGLRIERKQQKVMVDDLYLANPATTFQGFIPNNTKTSVIPSLGISMPIGKNTKVFASYSEGSKSADEENFKVFGGHSGWAMIANPDLKDEKSKNFELGFNHALGDNANIRFNTFYNKYTDLISSKNVPYNNGIAMMPMNVGKANVYGIEANINTHINENLSANVAATWMRGTEQSENGKKSRLLDTSPLKAVVGLDYHKDNLWGAKLNIKLVSKAPKPKGQGKFRTPGYGIANLSAWWKPIKGMTISGGVYNIFDKKYFSAAETNNMNTTNWYGPVNFDKYSQAGRNFSANLKYEY